MNDCIPFYEPGDDPTVHADVALTGRRFCDISATKQPGSNLSPSGTDQTSGGNIRAGKPTAKGPVLGVVSRDVSAGGKVKVWSRRNMVLPVEAAATMAARVECEVDAEGRIVAYTDGVKVGRLVADVTNGAFGALRLY